MNFDAARQIMVDSQIRPNDVSGPAIVSAFLRTPREAFVPTSKKPVAYSETEIETSDGRMLWTPCDTAKLIKSANVQPTDIVLVIGAGAGYEVALLAQLAETVIALEDSEELVDEMMERFGALEIDRAVPVKGDLAQGLADQAPFDVIYVCGMVQSVPDAWTEQLSEKGRLVVVEEASRGVGRGCVHTRAGDVVGRREVFDACPPRFAQFDQAVGFTL